MRTREQASRRRPWLDSLEDHLGPPRVGPYRILKKIGEGGMGVVYLGLHEVLEVQHAVKVLSIQLSERTQFVARFLREARQCARLDHRHIVKVYGAGEDPGVHYFAMEYVPGTSLRDWIDTEAIDVHPAVRYGHQIALALAYAHRRGVIHRDVKPDNILIAPGDVAKLTDFGLVRTMDRDGGGITLAGMAIGTPWYMSPEQWLGEAADPRTDVYGLGVVLFHALTGGFPFPGRTASEVVTRQREAKAEPILVLRPDLDGGLASIIEKATALVPAARYADGWELALAIEAWWRDHPPPLGSGLAIVPVGPAEEAPPSPSSSEAPQAITVVDRLIPSAPPLRAAPPPEVPARRRSSIPRPASPRPSAPALGAIEIAPDTWWIGRRDPKDSLVPNPYLRVFREGQQAPAAAILIDPGSSSSLAAVRSGLDQILGGPERLSAIFLNHEDPDACASITQLLGRIPREAQVICSAATWRFIVHLNLSRERFVDVASFAGGFELVPERILVPVAAPFCRSAGAVMLYDPETRVLFSGDVFGGLIEPGGDSLWADERDWAGIRAFHELYMPSSRALGRVIRAVRALDPPVEIIAPQHGRLLRGETIGVVLDMLEQLEVGVDKAEDLGTFCVLLERVVQRAEALGFEVRLALLTDPVLSGALHLDEGGLVIRRDGRAMVERALARLGEILPADAAEQVAYEAVVAAEELDLPPPRASLLLEKET